MDHQQYERMRHGSGFIAALDQSQKSTPRVLKGYGITESQYATSEEMFDLIHQMRTRVISSPSFTSTHILGTILFEQTMDRTVHNLLTGDYLWQMKGIVPFLKVDQGLADESEGVQLMKPMTNLDDLLKRAQQRKMFGTKMRSMIKHANRAGIQANVDQQFAYARIICSAGLVPIIEPEVNIRSEDKADAETMLKEELLNQLDRLSDKEPVMLKLSIPEQTDFYLDLIRHPRVVRVVALSGGYSRQEAIQKLARHHLLTASFSRALLEGLQAGQSDMAFDAMLKSSIELIYEASVT